MNKIKTKKVLVVEDDPGISELMELALSQQGYQILIVRVWATVWPMEIASTRSSFENLRRFLKQIKISP